MSKKVVLSAGHSFSDSGAYNPNKDLKESFLTMDIVKLALPLLTSQGINVSVIPDDLDLVETINRINKMYADYDLAIEVHVNAGGGRGIEGWY